MWFETYVIINLGHAFDGSFCSILFVINYLELFAVWQAYLYMLSPHVRWSRIRSPSLLALEENISFGIQDPKSGIQDPKSGIRNPNGGIRGIQTVESGIQEVESKEWNSQSRELNLESKDLLDYISHGVNVNNLCFDAIWSIFFIAKFILILFWHLGYQVTFSPNLNIVI
jgi:hypothetical protein